MEKKTMGTFLAALRRANGMTQRELAEKLNVSDKSVSRWENDDGTPDLALLPVIAEVFGVTCDELLRGERAATQPTAAQESARTEKVEKQRRRLLHASLSRFRSHSVLALALAAVGFLIAHGCNSALERALIGFFLGAVCFVGAAAIETVQCSAAFLAVSDEDLTGEDVDAYRVSVVRWAERTFGALWVLFATTLPLLLAFKPVDYNGFTLSKTTVGVTMEWYIFVLLALAALGIWALVVRAVNERLTKKGVGVLTEEESEARRKNRRLQRATALTLCAVMAATLFAGQTLCGFGDPRHLVEGMTFTDFNEFRRYMWQKVNGENSDGFAIAPEPALDTAIPSDTDTSGLYGTRRAIYDENGEEVYTYYQRNWSVSSISPGDKEDDYLPITVYTNSDMRKARSRAQIITAASHVLCAIECAGAVLIYRKKREK